MLDAPSSAQRQQAYDLLFMLEALDQQKRVTEFGKKMLQLGTEIRWAHMLVKAKELEQSLPGIEILSIYLLALLDSRVSQSAELSTELQAQSHRPHALFSKQLNYWFKRLNAKPSTNLTLSFLPILLALAYPDRLAKRRGEGYFLANGAGVNSRDDYWLNDEFIAIAEPVSYTHLTLPTIYSV